MHAIRSIYNKKMKPYFTAYNIMPPLQCRTQNAGGSGSAGGGLDLSRPGFGYSYGTNAIVSASLSASLGGVVYTKVRYLL